MGSVPPCQLSGGQQQRVGIAHAIATEPKFIVLDEPTASLDASVRADLLGTLGELKRELALAYLLISHDIATIRRLADRVVVLYRGVVVEEGPAAEVLANPVHPYTKALIDAVLPLRRRVEQGTYRLARTPLLESPEDGCVLYGRCVEGDEECVGGRIAWRNVSPVHRAACVKIDGSSPDKPAPVAGRAADTKATSPPSP